MAHAASELVNQIGSDCLALLLAAEMPHWVGIASFSTLLLSKPGSQNQAVPFIRSLLRTN